jgi:hypothetical protein
VIDVRIWLTMKFNTLKRTENRVAMSWCVDGNWTLGHVTTSDRTNTLSIKTLSCISLLNFS